MTSGACGRLALSLLLVATTTATGLGCRQPPAPAPRVTVRLTTGTPGAGFHPLGQALAKAYAGAFPASDITVQDSAGSVANVEALHRGSADIGLSYADVAYMAHVGRLGDQPQPFADLRGIAVLELAPVHLVVRAGSDISRPESLRGRTGGRRSDRQRVGADRPVGPQSIRHRRGRGPGGIPEVQRGWLRGWPRARSTRCSSRAAILSNRSAARLAPGRASCRCRDPRSSSSVTSIPSSGRR